VNLKIERKYLSRFNNISAVVASALGFTSLSFASPQALTQGRWAGRLHLSQQPASYGMIFDVFLAQPNSLRDFPRLEGLVRIALGGPLGAERMVFHFENIQYDFNSGKFTLDEENAEYILSLEVTDPTQMEGEFFHKPSGAKGIVTLRLADTKASGGEPCEPEEPCEPPDDPNGRIPKGQFVHALKGVYLGTCNGSAARFDLTGGQTNKPTDGASGPTASTMMQGQLGLTEIGHCTGSQDMCVTKSWSKVTAAPFLRTLQLSDGVTSDLCQIDDANSIQCALYLQGKQQTCLFKDTGVDELNVNPKFHATPKIALEPGDLDSLPEVSNDLESLRSALEGDYAGYVQLDANGRTLPLKFKNVATISTDNPHNEPFVFVSGSFQMNAGQESSPIVFSYERRTFFPTAGMTLQSKSSPFFAVISSWKKNTLSGELYDSNSGRLGLFSLKRDSAQLLSATHFYPSLTGNYFSSKSSAAAPWKFSLNPIPTWNSSFVNFAGSAQIMAPGLPFPKFELGDSSFDLATGNILIAVKDSANSKRFVSGFFTEKNELKFYIPGSMAWGTKMNEPVYLPMNLQSPLFLKELNQ
jgi:hypothetical protein